MENPKNPNPTSPTDWFSTPVGTDGEAIAHPSPSQAPEPAVVSPGRLFTEESPASKSETPDPLDPFNPANLVLDSGYLTGGGVTKLLTTVPVRKPGKQDFVRVHPAPEYRLCGTAMIELRDERETYLVTPAYAQSLDPQAFSLCNLYLAINRQKVVFLWPVKLPDPSRRANGWHTSALEGAERAMTEWVRLAPNMSLGAYEIFLAQAKLSDPEWPALQLQDFLRLAFKNHFITGADHPVMQRLDGKL
jgi:hypothetical protein